MALHRSIFISLLPACLCLFCSLDFLITFYYMIFKNNNVSLNHLGNVFGDSSTWGSCFLFCEQKLWLPLFWSVFQDYFYSEELGKMEWLQSHWIGLLIASEQREKFTAHYKDSGSQSSGILSSVSMHYVCRCQPALLKMLWSKNMLIFWLLLL